MLLVFWVRVGKGDSDDGMRGRVTERLKELGLDEGADLVSGLPVHSRETRESKQCAGVTEDLIMFLRVIMEREFL